MTLALIFQNTMLFMSAVEIHLNCLSTRARRILKKTLEKLLDRGGVYIGVSAGSIILAPTIQIAASVDPEPNETGMSDLTGLNLIDFEVHPHYESAQDAELSFYQEITKNKVVRISDSQALILSDSGQEVVE